MQNSDKSTSPKIQRPKSVDKTISNSEPLVRNTTLTSPEAVTPAFSPLYQQIKMLILKRLQAGHWKPSEAIPSELELANEFKVSQGTVRKAIDALATDNLLVRRQGKGTFVATHAHNQTQYRFLKLAPDTPSTQTFENMSGSDYAAQRKILKCERIQEPNSDILSILNLTQSTAVMHIQRVLSFAQQPTILENIWLPGTPFETLTLARLQAWSGALYALFESEFGIYMVRAQEHIKAIAANDEQARLLHVEAGSPLLSVERISFTYDDKPIELRRGHYLTHQHHYHNELF